MNKSVTGLAKKFIKKDLKKQLNFEAVEKYLNKIGYIVLFYDKDDNLEIIKKYDLIDYSNRCDGFTINDEEIKIVFIRKSLSSLDMLLVILHETGHIIMKHLDCKFTTANRHIQEIEADTFAYLVMNYNKNNTLLYSVICIILTSAISAMIGYNFHSGTKTYSELYTSPIVATPQPITATENPITVTDAELVQITPTGSKYHRPSCGYVKNKNCTALTREEAQKNYEPCRVCNP